MNIGEEEAIALLQHVMGNEILQLKCIWYLKRTWRMMKTLINEQKGKLIIKVRAGWISRRTFLFKDFSYYSSFGEYAFIQKRNFACDLIFVPIHLSSMFGFYVTRIFIDD